MTPTPAQLRAYVQKASSPKPIRLEVDGFGTVFVQVQTAYDQDVIQKKLEAAKKDDHCDTGRILACAMCDADGNLLYDIEDTAAVLELSKLPVYVQREIISSSNKANSRDPKH
jgi:hypothetical protein